jgi:NAD(P)-dependent dehydrogenase (short-subunit alcohol dehydrogenase family)
MIASEGGECMVCVANVTSSVDCAEIAARAVDQFGGIDIVVNNVGIAAKAATLEELTESEWRSVMDTNLSGVFLMSKAAMPHLLGRAGASIVNIASIAGERAHGAAAYGTSKAALIAFTRELAVIYGRAGIRANAIAPGHVFTPLVDAAIDAETRRIRRDIAPLSIEGDAWDIAAASLFLSSSEARFITGACLDVDGGVTQIAPLAAHLRLMAASI